MADSISFNGNIIDETGTAIDCKYRGYHKESGLFGSWRDSSSQYYSLDIIDSDWVTKDGTANNGDTIVIMYETQEAEVLDRQFGMYEFVLDGSKTYVQDVQIKSCSAPLVVGKWSISSTTDGNDTFANSDNGDKITSIGRTGDTISTSEVFTDEKSWEYSGKTMKQTASVYGTDVFSDRLGIVEKVFDWTEDDTFIADVTHVYSVISDGSDKSQDIEVKVTNKKGLIVNDILSIQIRYNAPGVDVSWDPQIPSVNDVVTVTGGVTDGDSRVTAISYRYNGVEVANNTTLNYEWVQDLGNLYADGGQVIGVNVSWNDGFSDYEILYSEHMDMTNLAPTFTIAREDVSGSDNTIKFTLENLVDPDGDDSKVEVKWKIEYQTPMDNQFVVVHNPGYPATADLDPKTWTFEVAGTYKVMAIAKDEYGEEQLVLETVIFTTGSSCEGEGRIRLNTENGKVRWQMISIPVKNKRVKEYFLDSLDAQIKGYDGNKGIGDVVERATAFPGNLGKSLSFVPGSTPVGNEGNFSLVMEDGVNLSEILGFWVGIKDYKGITGGDDLIFEWNMAD